MPFIKIGSGDANNFPLLEKATKLECPLVISTGMQTMSTIERINEIMTKANKRNYALLHCVSSYPTQPKDTLLEMLNILKNSFPQCVIGYSGHELGIDISKAAVLLGARIIERHFTLDKQQKGSDHKCSLEPKEFGKLIEDVRDIMSTNNFVQEISKEEILRLLENAPSVKDAFELFDLELNANRCILPCEMDCRLKLGKSIVAYRDLKAGEHIGIDDLCIKVSEPNGISAEYIDSVVGTELIDDVKRDEPLMWEHIIKLESTAF